VQGEDERWLRWREVGRACKVASVSNAPEEDEQINTRDNAESKVADGSASQTASRSFNGGAPAAPPRTPEDPLGLEDDAADGTAAGDPTAGVRISAEDAADAVPGDTGPEHPGQR